MVMDPARQFYSPYTWVGNNPIMGIDPTGGICPTCPKGSEYDAYRSSADMFNYEAGVGAFYDIGSVMVLGSTSFDVQAVRGSMNFSVGDFMDMQNQLAGVEAMMATFNPDNVAAILALAGGVEQSGGMGSGARVAANIKNANFAQKTFSNAFSAGGKFAGKTVDDVAAMLRSGKLSPSDVPISVVVREGQTLILNTRSSAALIRAGVSRSHWKVVNRSGQRLAEELLTGQLQRNNLSNAGVQTIRQSGTSTILR